MSRRVPAPCAGFTLIEVIAALLVFSAGVIMLLQLTGGLSRRLEHSAIESLISIEGQERLDSIAALPYAALPVTTDQDTLQVRGIAYTRTVTITQFSPLVRQLDVALAPTAGDGPSFDATTFVADTW